MWARIWLILQNICVKKHTEKFLEMLVQPVLNLMETEFKYDFFSPD